MAARRIATRINLLTVRQVQTAGEGDHSDGGGLVMRIREGSEAWVFRFTSPNGKRREMGLGVVVRNNAEAAGKSLVDARQRAHEARQLLQQAIDPIDARDAKKAAAKAEAHEKKSSAAREQLPLAGAARQYHERVIEPTRTPKHAAQWIASLEQHVPPELWHAPITSIEAPALLDFIAELHAKIPETASRIRQRLEVVFDDVEFRKLCQGNPARAIRRKLHEVKGRRDRGQFDSLDYRQAPAFLQRLRSMEGVAPRALEFAILTAARTSEVLGAVWSEIDVSGAIWRVPAARMKGGEDHVVYLSTRAVEVVESVRELGQSFVFPSPMLNGRPMSNMAMLNTLRRMKVQTTVHGFRATFSTWANETGAGRPDVIEACLAHQEQNRVRAAYNRAQFNAERQRLLQAWCDYLEGREATSNVVELKAA